MDGIKSEHYNTPIWPRDDTERELVERGRVRDKARGDAEDAARMRHAARRLTYAVHYPSYPYRIEANWDAEYGAEWRLVEAALLADENATLTAQLIDYAATKARLAQERILLDEARRENRALRAENNTLCTRLDAANARIAALENAALLDAPDEDAEMTPGAVRLDRASERPHYNMAPPRRTPPAA